MSSAQLSPWFLNSPYAAYVPPYAQQRDNSLGTLISNTVAETAPDSVKMLVIPSAQIANNYYIRLSHFFRISTTLSPTLTVTVRGGMGGENPTARGNVWSRTMTTVASATTEGRLSLQIATEGAIPAAAPGATSTIITRAWGELCLNNSAEPVAVQAQAATCNYFKSLPPSPFGSYSTMVFSVNFQWGTASASNVIRPEYVLWEQFPVPPV